MESLSSTAIIKDISTDEGFVYGHSPAIKALNGMVAEIAQTNIPVLFVGESGTGKEMYARLLHRLSGNVGTEPRIIDCGTVEDERWVARLHEVFQNRDNTANSGSVFLDGIDELDLTKQRVLLSLLSENEWKRRASPKSLRLISSATTDPGVDVESGRFRRELYYRLNGACLRLPPLRERKEDIATLTEYFLERHSKELGRKAPKLDHASLESLREHEWPGNIRELENCTRKIVAVGNLQAVLLDLRAVRFQAAKNGGRIPVLSLKMAAKAASRARERELILEALQRTKWNRKRAAKELQISYKSLLYKIKQMEGATKVLQEGGSK